MKKKIWIFFIGFKFILIGIIPIFLFNHFQIGLETLWFALGVTWIYSGIILKKEAKFRPLDHLIYFTNSFYLASILYVILLKPRTWNEQRIIYNIQITETLLLGISLLLTLIAAINHFSYKKKRPTKEGPVAGH